MASLQIKLSLPSVAQIQCAMCLDKLCSFYRYVDWYFVFCRTKYQKNVEASHNKGLKTVPNSIRSENYTITFEVEEEKYELELFC